MIGIALATLLFWSYCAAMSVLAKRDHPLLARRGLMPGSVALYVALIGVCLFAFLGQVRGVNALYLMFGLAGVLVGGVLLGYPYLAFMIGEVFDRAHAAATGIDRMKIRPTYDQAAKAERERRFAEALALYGQGAQENPEDAEPLRRMAEIHVARGELPEAISRLKEAYARAAGAEEKASLAFRAADLLARAGQDSAARETLESAARDLAGTPFEAYARTRLKAI
jgi:tetratricopeptide (TPR) repeat protein